MRIHRALPFVLALTAIACNSEVDPVPVDEECHDANTPGCVVASSKQRIEKPVVPEADMAALVSGNTAFTVDLYDRLRAEPGNLFYSPHSMSIALAMTWAGARGETEQKMAEAMRFTLPQAQLHPAFNALDQALASRGQGAQGKDGQGFRLNIANALWGQIGYTFEAPFLDTLGLNYGAGMRVVDFVDGPAQALDLINGWVEERTEGRIKDILSPDSINSSTRLVLTNAIYFNAAWETPFEVSNTKPDTFTRGDDTTVAVDMMSGYLDTNYGEGADYAAVELPYDGHELSMVLVLPTDMATFEPTLDAAKLDGVLSSLGGRGVSLEMPKFKFESEFSMVEPLIDMGMGVAFTDGADFSGINGTGGLAISDVLHKAFVAVDEAGTEAAAATAVIVGETSAPEPAAIRLDRPFLFFIRDIKTGAVLFFGRVSDPST